MSVNGITNSVQTYETKSKTSKNVSQSGKSDSMSASTNNMAAVYEKGTRTEDDKKIYKPDTVTIEKMKAEADRRTESLRNLVEKMLRKQGQTFTDTTDMYALLREGKLQVDPEVIRQANKDIADDGYWGVEQTSDRIVSFAKALSGGDPSKADELIEAVKKGFSEATKSWGGKLPDICQNTLDAAIKKMEAWRDGTEGNDESKSMSDNANDVFTEQARAEESAN